MTNSEKLIIKQFTDPSSTWSFPASDLPAKIVEEARRWVGVPFRHAGRDRMGIDCVGLPIKILHFLGYTDWDDINYSRSVNPQRMKNEIELFCNKVEGGFRYGKKSDLLWFNILGSNQHVGIFTGFDENTLIHAYESAGKVVEHDMNEKWIQRVETVFRFKGLE